MKFTLCVTLTCNMSCSYCYIKHRELNMSDEIAKQAVDFIYNTTPPEERIEIGFFGGEPLLHPGLVEKIVHMLREHQAYAASDIDMTLVTNATRLNDEIIQQLVDWGMGISVSCDGPPMIQDRFRRFMDGSATSALVEKNLKLLVTKLPGVMVNAVYGPETAPNLVQSVDYFSSLGVRRIYLSPDFSARWTAQDAACLADVYDALGKRYCDYYRAHDPHYISLIDSKIAVILRGGYQKQEQCSMGRGEFAITPQGNIYPCERLIGDGSGNSHCIGTLETGPQLERLACHMVSGDEINKKCALCELQNFCMNWCSCSNFFATGFYNWMSEFVCASERSALQTAMNVVEDLGDMAPL